MKRKFSIDWKGSKQPRKQRKYRNNAPSHIKNKFLSAHLSKELRKKHNTRNITLKKGDKVKIARGQFKGKTGAVDRINLKKAKVKPYTSRDAKLLSKAEITTFLKKEGFL